MYSIVRVYLLLLELLNIYKNPGSYKVIGTRDRILYGHSFRNITGMRTMDQCLGKCLEDCKCLSFQICENDKICQLCSSNREQNEESLQLGEGCSSFVFKREQTLQIRTSVQNSCVKDTNCCLTSQPCDTGGLCVPNNLTTLMPHSRFKCKCRPGYQGEYCEQPIRSCHGHRTGIKTKKGVYLIIDSNGNSFRVRCHFGSNWTWTLIQTFNDRGSLDENITQPVNENDPNAVPYRLSHFRIVPIRQNSSMWRILHGFWGTRCWDLTYVGIDSHQKKCTSCETYKYNNTKHNLVKKKCHHYSCQDQNSGGNIDNYGSFCCYNSTSNECSSNTRTRIFLGQHYP